MGVIMSNKIATIAMVHEDRAVTVVDSIETVIDRINELEEQMLKINDFDRKVAARNTWRRRSGKTHGRWNK